MYAKIFDSIYDGTLVEDWRALITFEQMLILCDSEGFIDMTPYAIARRTGIPIEHIEAGIRFLEQPDPNSRTDVEEGRRIARLDPHRAWGWRIVNHKKYKEMRTVEDRREYMKEYMRDYRKNNKENQQPSKQESLPKPTVNESKQPLAQLADAYTDAYADTDTKNITPTSGLPPDGNQVLKNKRNYKAEALEVLEFLNAKAGKKYRGVDANGKMTANLTIIIDRLKTGVSVQDCKTVIARKHREWTGQQSEKYGKNMLEYLAPDTLFRASKFEKYLGQCVVSEKSKFAGGI